METLNALQASSENAAELKKAWEDAEAKIKEVNDRVHEYDIELAKYQTERSTITSMGGASAWSMWSPFDIVKGLFTNAHPLVRLFELDKLIYYVYGQMEECNGLLYTHVNNRDHALTAYT